MDSSSLISEGAMLMLLGMGTVFVFLSLLVLMMTLISSLVQRFLPATPESGDFLTSADIPPATLLALVSAAIHRHRQQNRN